LKAASQSAMYTRVQTAQRRYAYNALLSKWTQPNSNFFNSTEKKTKNNPNTEHLALSWPGHQWRIHGEERGAEKIFLNVCENKSSDRKLSPIRSRRPLVKSNSNFEGFEDILTPKIGTGINDTPDPPSTIFWTRH